MVLEEFHISGYNAADAGHMATDASQIASDACCDMTTRDLHKNHTLTTLAVSPAALEDLPDV